jgi:hypothetical protein
MDWSDSSTAKSMANGTHSAVNEDTNDKGSQGVGIATLIFRYFLRYFSSTHRTDLSRFRGTFHSFDPVGFAIFAIAHAGQP